MLSKFWPKLTKDNSNITSSQLSFVMRLTDEYVINSPAKKSSICYTKNSFEKFVKSALDPPLF